MLDPRAGLVDVELPTLRYDPQQFVDLFKSLRLKNSTTTKARKQLQVLIDKYGSFFLVYLPVSLLSSL